MGNSISRSPPNGGLRVHRVYPNGPADHAGIEPFFDFVLDCDNYTFTDDNENTFNLFLAYINKHENTQVCLNVYNVRKKTIREVFIIPRKWQGIGLLGMTLKFGLFDCMNEAARVINIYDNSPAHKAGLQPFTDYLLGTDMQLFFDLESVRINVANHVDKDITLVVYNTLTEKIRRVTITPNEDWGGKGSLGCDLATGYIHKVPYVKALLSFTSEGLQDALSHYDSKMEPKQLDIVDTIDISIHGFTPNSTVQNNQDLKDNEVPHPGEGEVDKDEESTREEAEFDVRKEEFSYDKEDLEAQNDKREMEYLSSQAPEHEEHTSGLDKKSVSQQYEELGMEQNKDLEGNLDLEGLKLGQSEPEDVDVYNIYTNNNSIDNEYVNSVQSTLDETTPHSNSSSVFNPEYSKPQHSKVVEHTLDHVPKQESNGGIHFVKHCDHSLGSDGEPEPNPDVEAQPGQQSPVGPECV